MPFARSASRGFSLIEALVAASLMGTAIVTLAHLVALGTHQTIASRRVLTATVAAQSKLEQLRALSWTYAPDGGRLSDTDLSPSPTRSLLEDIAGYVDHLDEFGTTMPPAGDDVNPQYVRRWAISPLESFDADTLILQVCVFQFIRGSREGRRPEVCLWTIRTRRP